MLRELAQGSSFPVLVALTAATSWLDLGAGFQGDALALEIGSGFQAVFCAGLDQGVSLLLALALYSLVLDLAALLPVRPASRSYSLAFVSRFSRTRSASYKLSSKGAPTTWPSGIIRSRGGSSN